MQAILIHLTGGKQGHREAFTSFPVRIGRSSSNDLILTGEELRASSRHAEIISDNGNYLLKDLESTNGTFVNGLRITQTRLSFGDTIEFGLGGPKLRFEFPEVAENPVAKSSAVPHKAHRTMATDASSPAPNIEAHSIKPADKADKDDHSKEFGRTTVQLMLNKAVQQSSRKWKILVAASFLVICATIGLVLFLQLKYFTKNSSDGEKVIKKSPPPKSNFSDIAKRNQRAIVLIYNKFELYDKSGRLIQEQISNGSGFIANKDGEVITNRHVIEPWEFKLPNSPNTGLANRSGVTGKSKLLGVFFADDPLDAEHMHPVEGYEISKEADVAVLRIKPSKNVESVEQINNDMSNLQQGDDIIVLSFPLGLEINELTQDKKAKTSLTKGSISKIPDNQKQIQLNVAAYEGSSGGPIFNNSGEVIGLLTSGPNDTLNFGTPIKYATKLLKSK